VVSASENQQRRPTIKQEISVADLRRRLGERRVVPFEIVLPPLEVVATRTTDLPVVGEVTFESIERGVTVTGHIELGWEGECRRCLDAVGGTDRVEIMDIYQVGAPDDVDEIVELVDDLIDLVPMVRDAALLGLPLAPLCRDDCVGPDPDRYPTLTEEQLEASAARTERPPDPRWAALGDLDLGDVDVTD
jgi:uncharacterized protein